MKAAAADSGAVGNTSEERIRTYHEPEQRVKDHRTSKTYRYSDVLDGKLDELFEDLQRSG
jgi:protein subunit release factor A